MKNKIILGVTVLMAASLAACSDGVLPKAPELDPSITCSSILQAYKAGEDPASAVTGDITIAEGEGVALTWSVSGENLKSAQLSSTPPEVVGPPVQLEITEKEVGGKDAADSKKADKKEVKKIKVTEGSKEYPGLTHNVNFKVEGVSEEKGKKETPCPAHLNVTVTPTTEELTINKFEVTPTEINKGETAKLCWDVSPAGSAIAIVDDAGNTIALPAPTEPPAPTPIEPVAPPATPEDNDALKVSGSAKAIEEDGDEEPSAPEELTMIPSPASGCVDVSPAETTMYTLTATPTEGESVTKSATVVVKEAELQIKFLANGQSSLNLTEASDVRLSWDVTPAEAVVTIDPAVGEGGPLASVGNATVRVSETITYTLTASLGDKVAPPASVTINVQQLAASQLAVTLSANRSDIFEGESVVFAWSVVSEDATTIPQDARVFLQGPSWPVGQLDITKPGSVGNNASVELKISGEYSVLISSGGDTIESNKVSITVRRWNVKDKDEKWGSIASVSEGLTVLGSFGGSPSSIKFGRVEGNNDVGEVLFDLGAKFKELYFSTYDVSKLASYGSFTVHSVRKSGDGKRLYAAMPGMLAYSDNSGKTWDAVDIFVVFQGAGASEYPSCRGSTQVGDKTGKASVANIQQICDVASLEGGRLLVAGDHGVYYMDNVDAFMKNRTGGAHWKGIPGNVGSTTNALSGVVVDSLLIDDGSIYAGTAKGVWVSRDRGDSWESLNGGDLSETTAVYVLAVAGADKRLYAAGPSGVYVKNEDTWKKLDLDGGTVYALAIDPVQDSTIYAGTENGMFVSRNGGEKWTDITSMDSKPVVYGLMASKYGSKVSIYAATNNGVYGSTATIISSGSKPEEPEPSPAANPAEPPPTATEAMGALAR